MSKVKGCILGFQPGPGALEARSLEKEGKVSEKDAHRQDTLTYIGDDKEAF